MKPGAWGSQILGQLLGVAEEPRMESGVGQGGLRLVPAVIVLSLLWSGWKHRGAFHGRGVLCVCRRRPSPGSSWWVLMKVTVHI